MGLDEVEEGVAEVFPASLAVVPPVLGKAPIHPRVVGPLVRCNIRISNEPLFNNYFFIETNHTAQDVN